MTPRMANQRKPGTSRITVTIPDELLREIEDRAAARAEDEPGFDRLAYIREAIMDKLMSPDTEENPPLSQPPKSSKPSESE